MVNDKYWGSQFLAEIPEFRVHCVVAVMVLVDLKTGKKPLFIQSVCIVCKQGTVMNSMSHSLQAMQILSAFFDTPRN